MERGECSKSELTRLDKKVQHESILTLIEAVKQFVIKIEKIITQNYKCNLNYNCMLKLKHFTNENFFVRSWYKTHS